MGMNTDSPDYLSPGNSSLCMEPGSAGNSYMIGSEWFPDTMCARAMCIERAGQLYVSYMMYAT